MGPEDSVLHQGSKKILVNLAGVDYVDSAGLGELLGAYTTVTKAGGTMCCATARPTSR